MTDPRLLSAEDLMRIFGNLKSVGFMAAAIPLASHIDAQAEQIITLKKQPWEMERTADYNFRVQAEKINELQQQCEKTPGYVAQAEAHRQSLLERDELIAALTAEIQQLREDVITLIDSTELAVVERNRLIEERDGARRQVALLRDAVDRWQWVITHNEGRPDEDLAVILNDTAAAALAYEQRIREEACAELLAEQQRALDEENPYPQGERSV